MATPSHSTQRIRFGEFELDLFTRELWTNGTKQTLAPQPFQVLQFLIENRGQLVTRDVLVKHIWPSGTFVDYEQGLKKAINRLREALNDSAAQPRLIENLPRQGYRFIGAVEVDNADHARIRPAEPIVLTSRLVTEEPKSARASRLPIGNYRLMWVLVVVAFAAIVGLLYLWLAPKVARLTRLRQLQQLKVQPLTALPGNVASPTFSPDGSQVAFAWDGENGGKGFDLYVKVIGSENQLRLTNQPGSYHAAWSPDGKSIAIERSAANFAYTGVYLISPLGGPERKITDRCFYGFPTIGVIAWSPNGKQLACIGFDPPSNTTSLLFVISLDSLQLTPLRTDCKRVISPAFSPDGDYLAWTCSDTLGGSASIELQRLRDGRITQLLRRTDGIGGPRWLGDDHRMVFTSPIPTGDIFEFSLDYPDQPEKLPVGHDAFDLAVSPAGKLLAFAQSHTNVNIWRLDLAEPQPHARMAVTSSRQQNAPNVSPNGDQIAFESNRSGSNEVWVSAADGSNAVQLSSFGIRMTGSPRWSPDGKLIAFDSRAGGEANICLGDPHGGVPRKLDIDIHGNSQPSWSRDGKWLYFVNGEDAHHPTGWKVPATGGHAVPITDGEASKPIESPDGRFVYFVRQSRLWSVRTDGTVAQPVDGMPYVRLSGWTPVDTGIYFIFYEGGRPGIAFFDLATKKTRLVYVLEKPLPMWVGGIGVSPDGKWLLFPQLDEQSSDLMMIENWN